MIYCRPVRTMAKELKISAIYCEESIWTIWKQRHDSHSSWERKRILAPEYTADGRSAGKRLRADLEREFEGRRCGMKEEEIRSLFELIMEDE